MEIEQGKDHRESIINLLSSENLPAGDLPKILESFLVMLENGEVIGAAGVEQYGDHGLLRSLVVSAARRGMGIAGKLVERMESLSASKGLTGLYLLTETAPEYFSKKGYEKISREDVPAEVQQSSEFKHVCPQSAIVMKKNLII